MHNDCNNGNKVVWSSPQIEQTARLDHLAIISGYSTKTVKLDGLFVPSYQLAGNGLCASSNADFLYSLDAQYPFAKVDDSGLTIAS